MGGSRLQKSRLLEPRLVASKNRKMGQKVVMTVKMEEANGLKQKNEGPPSDCWSWRKYGQKPIKGSPYPRGYYKCSTSKGCSARKQVERSSRDASLFIITYTSTHNHPGPSLPSSDSNTEQEHNEDSPPATQEAPTIVSPEDINDDPLSFHYYFKSTFSYDDLPLSYPQLMEFPKSDLSGENDFYDELGELQLPPSSTSLSGIFEEAILLDPP